MKKLILISALFLLTGIIFGQVLPKGTIIGTHTLTVTLKPGVTLDQYIEFLKNKLIPEVNKNDPNWQIYVVKSINGNFKNSFGLIHVIKSEQDWVKYVTVGKGSTELGKIWAEKVRPVREELEKLGTYTSQYTDWLVL